MATVAAVTRQLTAADTAHPWASANVFVPDTKDRAAPTDLDRAILKNLDYLIQVCHEPLDRLGVEQDLVPAARARRVPAAGLRRLASHREDWYGIEHGRIRPRQLVSLTYVEDHDFHENQVAAQLVDRLHSYLADRLDDLRDLGQHLADVSRYEQTLREPQSVWKSRRLSNQLAGVARDIEDPSALIAQTTEDLRRAHSIVLGLRSSRVYRTVSRRTRLPIQLRRTNLLNNNDRYFRVAKLWDEWARNEVAARQAYGDGVDEFAADYSTYVAAMVMRACASVDLAPIDDSAPTPAVGSPVELANAIRRYTFVVTRDGSIQLQERGQPVVQVLAIEHALTREKSAATIWRDVQRIFARLETASVPVIVAYPGMRPERRRLPEPLRQLVHASGTLRSFGAPPELVGLVPITPFEIEGIERMARALRWVILGRPMLERYPHPVRLPHLLQGTHAWLAAAGRTQQVIRRPTAQEREVFISELRQLDAQARMPNARRSNMNSTTEANAALDTAEEVFDLLEQCPVCAYPGSTSRFEPRDDSTFHCRCTNCGTHWGTRECRSCRQKYPVLWPRGARYTGDDGDQLDATFGQDLLALPCATSPDGSRFRCPWCGRCQGAPSCGCQPPASHLDERQPEDGR